MTYVPNPSRLAEIESRVESLRLPGYMSAIFDWLDKRPLIAWSDSNRQKMARLLAGEIYEQVAELNRSDIELVPMDVLIEMVDQLFLALGFCASTEIMTRQPLTPDYDFIRRNIDGHQVSPATFQYQIALASHLAEKSNPVVVIEQMLIVWASTYSKLEHWQNVGVVLERVLKKNTDNYPAEYFQFHYKLKDGRLVALEDNFDKQMAFEHRVRCLRTIRDVLKIVRRNNPSMVTTDHSAYRELILDHTDGNYYKLCLALVEKYRNQGLTLEMVLHREDRPHRLVPSISGILRPGQDWQIQPRSETAGQTVQLVH